MKPRFRSLTQNWSWDVFWSGFRLAIVAGLFLLGVRGMRPDTSGPEFRTLAISRDHLFDFAQWEGDAVIDKALTDGIAPQQYMSPAQRVAYVRAYLKLVGDIGDLEDKIETIYADPAQSDPATASADLRARRDSLRAEQRGQQALAESIIQSQVSELLVEYGFGTAGQVLPPLEMRFTQLPTILIVSRRESIDRTGAYPLEHGLTVEQQQSLESAIDSRLGVSSLIAPLGGLAVYPAMLIETSDVQSVYNITAHEWTHHYLSFYPLGFNYGRTADLYTINETVASMVGGEIGWAVLHRYMPDLAGPPPDYTPKPPEQPRPRQPGQPGQFVFQTQMRGVRVEVDALLAEGRVEEAEDYMERSRAAFVDQGYRIRKVNQAYFAFYGSYADQPGATGSDPIGPALRELRYNSPSLHDFIALVRGMTTLDEIQSALARARQLRAGESTGGAPG
jgi:hypothetical protein